jgi:AmiR/NasT family two-component response regulator
MTHPLHIALADERDTREPLRRLLTALGHQVVTAEGGRQLVELCRASAPDLVIAGACLPDRGGIAVAGLLAAEHPFPVILLADRAEEELPPGPETDYVLGYLVRPVEAAVLRAALALARLRFAKFQAARREAADLRQALDDRKVIERAKGVVMRRLGLGEEEAYRRLRQVSSGRSVKLAEVAQMVLGAEEVFRELNGC